MKTFRGKILALVPGHVISKNDGQRHYISASRLAELYGIPPGQYIVWDRENPYTYRGRDKSKYHFLFPRADGKYELPAEIQEFHEA